MLSMIENIHIFIPISEIFRILPHCQMYLYICGSIYMHTCNIFLTLYKVSCRNDYSPPQTSESLWSTILSIFKLFYGFSNVFYRSSSPIIGWLWVTYYFDSCFLSTLSLEGHSTLFFLPWPPDRFMSNILDLLVILLWCLLTCFSIHRFCKSEVRSECLITLRINIIGNKMFFAFCVLQITLK